MPRGAYSRASARRGLACSGQFVAARKSKLQCQRCDSLCARKLFAAIQISASATASAACVWRFLCAVLSPRQNQVRNSNFELRISSYENARLCACASVSWRADSASVCASVRLCVCLSLCVRFASHNNTAALFRRNFDCSPLSTLAAGRHAPD